jgi:hypothetical protein
MKKLMSYSFVLGAFLTTASCHDQSSPKSPSTEKTSTTVKEIADTATQSPEKSNSFTLGSLPDSWHHNKNRYTIKTQNAAPYGDCFSNFLDDYFVGIEKNLDSGKSKELNTMNFITAIKNSFDQTLEKDGADLKAKADATAKLFFSTKNNEELSITSDKVTQAELDKFIKNHYDEPMNIALIIAAPNHGAAAYCPLMNEVTIRSKGMALDMQNENGAVIDGWLFNPQLKQAVKKLLLN